MNVAQLHDFNLSELMVQFQKWTTGLLWVELLDNPQQLNDKEI